MKPLKKKNSKPEIFCHFPFDRAHISLNGDIFCCCASWINHNSYGSVFKSGFEEVWNSRIARKIRRSILKEKFSFCNHKLCPRMVGGMIKDRRLMKRYENVILERKTILDQGPRFISMNYDNSCNLYCASCRPAVQRLSKKQLDFRLRFQDKLLRSRFFSNVKVLTVSGSGEVFASRAYMELFQKLREEDFPELKIILRTNGILLTPRNWDRISSVHYAVDMISISVDAANAATYAELRRGGDFSILMENLEFLSGLKKKFGFRVKLNFVVQQKNFREMKNFVEMARRFGFDAVDFTKLVNLTYTEESFRLHAIDNERHPEYQEFLRTIRDPALSDPMINWTNLARFVRRVQSSE